MKRFVLRFLAYAIAGAVAGAVAKAVVSGAAPVSAQQAAFLGVTIAGALGASLWLLVQSSIGLAHGIRTSPPWTVAVLDAVCIIAVAVACFFILDGYAPSFLDRPPQFTDPLAADVIAMMLVPSMLILAVFVTTMAGQTVSIDETGIRVAGPFGVKQAAWADIRSLAPNSQDVVVTRLDTPVPETLRINLEIRTASGETFTVYQPSLKKTASLIIKKTKQNAPARLAGDIRGMADAWL